MLTGNNVVNKQPKPTSSPKLPIVSTHCPAEQLLERTVPLGKQSGVRESFYPDFHALLQEKQKMLQNNFLFYMTK